MHQIKTWVLFLTFVNMPITDSISTDLDFLSKPLIVTVIITIVIEILSYTIENNLNIGRVH